MKFKSKILGMELDFVVTYKGRKFDEISNMEQDTWAVKINGIEFPYFMGLGHHGKMPNLDMVLESLITEAYIVHYAEGFCDLVDEFGYTCKQAKEIFEACKKVESKLRELFPEFTIPELADILAKYTLEGSHEE